MGDESVSWEAGTIIHKFGEKSHYAYLLKKGAVEIIFRKWNESWFCK